MAVIKAVLTRLVFAAHGGLAIWQVVQAKSDPLYWYLTCPILLLVFEGIVTLVVKETHEWKWFCPSVFLYLSSVVPAIWLLELDKVERRFGGSSGYYILPPPRNDTKIIGSPDLAEALAPWLGPDVVGAVTPSTWVTVIEQLLMLVLIIGRWMLPKGELTRDQLSQLLLVYIGTAADIIELFDSFKDDTIAREPILVVLTLAIWSWSLLQFTVVLTATKSRKSRAPGSVAVAIPSAENSGIGSETTRWCTIDFWAIALNIGLQDLPFLAFRLLLILHFRIITYMNIFFTCKNTLVIVLQLYRLYVVQTEARAVAASTTSALPISFNPTGSCVMIAPKPTPRVKNPSRPAGTVASISSSLENREAALAGQSTESRGPEEVATGDTSVSASETDGETVLVHLRRCRRTGRLRQDTGYSTASSSQDAVSLKSGDGNRRCRHCRRCRRP